MKKSEIESPFKVDQEGILKEWRYYFSEKSEL